MELEKLKECLNDGWRKEEPYLFVSYASKDKEKVYRFVYELRKLGINVYIDLELKGNITTNWLKNVKDRLYDVNCMAMISFLSIHYFRSYACLIEQLIIRSKRLKQAQGELLLNICIALDKTMENPQIIRDIIYKREVAKESQKNITKMLPEEVKILKSVIENNVGEPDDIKTMLEIIDELKTQHDVATFMYSYVIFKEETLNIQPYDTAEKCAKILYDNCINEKNNDINISPLEELKAEYEGYSSKLHTITPKEQLKEEPKETIKEESEEQSKEKVKEKPVEEITWGQNPIRNVIEKKKKVSSTTGDITFTLYGKEYTLNQSDMMLTFFAQVLNKHTEVLDSIFQYQGMNCVSELDYTQRQNQNESMPSYFRNCEFFTFSDGKQICVGTAYAIGDKLKKMALLLEICNENPEIFSSEQVSLPSAKAVTTTGGSSTKGKSSLVKFRIFGESYEQNQSDMLGTVCSTLLKKYPEKLTEAAESLLCIDAKDYRMVEKEDRPVYFSSMNYYEINGMPCSVGGSFGMKDKLKMIGKLLAICGEDTNCIEIEDYEIPTSALKTSRNKNINYFG